MNKKGNEMSINVVVGLILGIIMFAAAAFIFFRIMSQSDKTANVIDEQTQQKIYSALDSGEPVYIPASTVVAKKNSANFWVGIRNIGDVEGKFRINVKVDPIPAGFNMTRVAYFGKEGSAIDANIFNYPILAKETQVVRVSVNTKGVTGKITLVVTAEKYNGEIYETYGKPKIVYVEP